MQGLSSLSFFSVKKNPTVAGDMEGLMKPAARAFLIQENILGKYGFWEERQELNSVVPWLLREQMGGTFLACCGLSMRFLGSQLMWSGMAVGAQVD